MLVIPRTNVPIAQTIKNAKKIQQTIVSIENIVPNIMVNSPSFDNQRRIVSRNLTILS